MRVSLLSSLAVVFLSACAAQKLQPTTVSSTNSAGYALGYSEALHAAADSFNEHKTQAHELSSQLVREAPKPKADDDRGLLLHVVDQADADGRREQNVRSRRSERQLRAFWEAERGHIGARVGSAAQKQVTEGGCENVQTQAAVQQALRESVARQLEKRTRKASEAQRVLEQSKDRLSPATLNAAEESADDITLASYLVYVALVDDVLELQRLRNERDAVIGTLQDALQRERAAAESGKLSSKELEASEKRQGLLASRITASQNESVTADRTLTDYEAQLKQARAEYEHALAGVRASIAPPPAQTTTTATTRR
jgi:hypothetical protein